MEKRPIVVFTAIGCLIVLGLGFSIYRGAEYRKAHPEQFNADQLSQQIKGKAKFPSLGLQDIVPDYSASIVFDNSTCKKLDFNMQDRELIRQQDWYDYHVTWKAHLTSKLVAFTNTAVTSLGQLYLEDARVLGWASKMPSCFTPKQNKVILSSLQQAKKNLANIPSWYDRGYLFPQDVYPSYKTIKDFINSVN
jgi:hypothetical protein